MDNLKLEILNLSDLTDWDEKIKSSAQGTVFNTNNWAKVLENVFNLKNFVYCVTKNNNIIGAMLVYYKVRYGIKVITQIPITSYNGILFFIDDELKAQKSDQYITEIQELIQRELQKEFKFCDFTLHPSINDIRTFQWNNWVVLPQYTYQVSLKDEELIWKNFSSSLRRKINHLNDTGLIIKEEINADTLIEMHQESYRGKGMSMILDKESLLSYVQKVKEKGLIKIYTIYNSEGKVCASRALVLWNNIVYDWIAGTSTELKENNATHYLVWKILQKYSKEKYDLFDFMGANTKKIIDFKKSFGGNLVPYYEVKYYSSKWIKILFSINEFRHKLMR